MIKLKDLLKESSPGFENRQFGDPLPTLEDIAKKYQEKNGQQNNPHIKESDLGYTTKKQKVVRAVHKASGKELIYVDTPSSRKMLKKMGFVVKESVNEKKGDFLSSLFPKVKVDKAIKIAKKMSGNMTGAVKAIEKFFPGMSKHNDVQDALRQANESVDEGFGGELKGKDKEKFEKARKENAEQLGYKLTGESDIREAKFDATGVDWSGEMMWKWVSKALKAAGIKELKYTPMKSGWLGGKFIWGGFYKVQANKRTDVLPITVDKKGNVHLNVSPKKFVIGKIGKLPQVVKNLKDFKKSDMDVYESVNEAKSKTMKTIGSIIGQKQAQKISGVLVDMQTALVIMKVWNALNKSNRSKFEKLPIKKMATVAWKLMK